MSALQAEADSQNLPQPPLGADRAEHQVLGTGGACHACARFFVVSLVFPFPRKTMICHPDDTRMTPIKQRNDPRRTPGVGSMPQAESNGDDGSFSPMSRRFIMTIPLTLALTSSMISAGPGQPMRTVCHHLALLGGAALAVYLVAAAPGIAIPMPPGVGGGSTTTSSSAGGSRRPMKIATAQPPGCNGVIGARRMIHR